MTKLERGLLSVSRQRLTSEEFHSLEELSRRQRSIPDQHRERLAKAGYVRELVDPKDGVYALAVTGRGLRRLEVGK
jgi:hypothetical protein